MLFLLSSQNVVCEKVLTLPKATLDITFQIRAQHFIISFLNNANNSNTYISQWGCTVESSQWHPHRWERKAPKKRATQWNDRACALCPPGSSVWRIIVKMIMNSTVERTDLPLYEPNYERWSRKKWKWNSLLRHLAEAEKEELLHPKFYEPIWFYYPIITDIKMLLNALNTRNIRCINISGMSVWSDALIYALTCVIIKWIWTKCNSCVGRMVLWFGLMANLLCLLWVTEYPRQRLQSCDLDIFSLPLSFSYDGVKVLLRTRWEKVWMQLLEAKSQKTEQNSCFSSYVVQRAILATARWIITVLWTHSLTQGGSYNKLVVQMGCLQQMRLFKDPIRAWQKKKSQQVLLRDKNNHSWWHYLGASD